MICSLNEVRTLLRKAAVGSGFSVGEADDIGRAGAWLCAHEFDGFGAALQAIGPGAPGAITTAQNAKGLVIRNARIGRCGPSALDLLGSATQSSVTLMACDAPLLIVGMAGATADVHAIDFHIDFGDGATATVTQLGAALVELPARGVDATLTCRPREFDTHAASPPAGVTVDQDAWNKASALAARTYVPATDASRLQGAGAGLNDND